MPYGNHKKSNATIYLLVWQSITVMIMFIGIEIMSMLIKPSHQASILNAHELTTISSIFLNIYVCVIASITRIYIIVSTQVFM